MRIENQIYKIGDLGKVITGKTPSSSNPDYFGQQVPFVTPTDFGSYSKNVLSSLRYLSESGVRSIGNKILPVDSILVSCIGSDMGKVVMNKVSCVTNQQINSIIPNFDIVDPDFLYYKVLSLYELLRNMATGGSTMPIINKTDFENIEIDCPPLPTQRRIAAILTALDDKIELNRRMNETLEGIAQALWQEWFGKYASGEEELPEGWRWGKLNEMYKTTSGGTPTRLNPEFFENGTIEWVKSKELKEIFVLETEECITELALKKSSAKLLPARSVLVAMYGATVGEVSILSKSAACNQALCAILPNDTYPFSYAFLFLSNEKKSLKNLATGAAQQNISQELIQNLELPIPSVSDLKTYRDAVEPLFETILMNLTQSRTLSTLRDTLLPRLMRGEIV